MAITVGNHYTNFISRSGSYCTYSFYAEWWGNTDAYDIRNRYFNYEYGTVNYTPDTNAESGAWYSALSADPTDIPVDVTMSWYPYMDVAGLGQVYGSTINTKTVAIPATSSTPTYASVTSSNALVSCNFVPNVTESTTSAQLQYKRTVDSTWISFGTPKTDGTGYGTVSITNESLTGLTSSTSYDLRLVITRTTANDTTTTSSTASFTTAVGAPTVTTDAASVVTSATAQLNASVVVNAGTTVTVYWKWDTVNPPVANTTSSQSVSGDGAYSLEITGLAASTPYYARAYVAFATPTGSPANGSVVSFTTAADPAVEAANEDHMTIYEFNERKYGTASSFYLTVASPAATSSDRFFNAASPFVAGDVQLSKDGAAFANVGTLPTRVGSTSVFKLDLDATEMQFSTGIVQIVDQNGPAFRDAIVLIRTKQELGNMDIDASQLTNTSALKLTGIGTGSGLEAIAGATGMDIKGVLGKMVQRTATAASGGASSITLDASASATNDYYNGAVILVWEGTGAGQARVITDYVGGTKAATVNKAWATNPDNTSKFVIFPGTDAWAISPGAELSAAPTYASNYADLLQFVFQRFMYKRDQTATLFQTYKSDSTTVLASAAVADDGATESHNKLT